MYFLLLLTTGWSWYQEKLLHLHHKRVILCIPRICIINYKYCNNKTFCSMNLYQFLVKTRKAVSDVWQQCHISLIDSLHTSRFNWTTTNVCCSALPTHPPNWLSAQAVRQDWRLSQFQHPCTFTEHTRYYKAKFWESLREF